MEMDTNSGIKAYKNRMKRKVTKEIGIIYAFLMIAKSQKEIKKVMRGLERYINEQIHLSVKKGIEFGKKSRGRVRKGES
jgi:hypothetical protein